jgi:hypothetical protein
MLLLSRHAAQHKPGPAPSPASDIAHGLGGADMEHRLRTTHSNQAGQQSHASHWQPSARGMCVRSVSEQEGVEPASEANASAYCAHGQQCPADIRRRCTARVMTDG